MNITKYFTKKPLFNEDSKQLFAVDINSSGAKKWFFDTYENMYDFIINYELNHINEDTTFSKSIKLHIDIDHEQIFSTELERDKIALNLYSSIIVNLMIKIYKELKINDPAHIVLISDTLNKLSLHIIFPTIIFNNIYDMKLFMNDVQVIDKAIYRIGCFRMYKCSKLGKNNKLILLKTNYYNYIDEYNLFLDTCICYVRNNETTVNYINQNQHKNINQNILSVTSLRNFTYINIDFNKISLALDKLQDYSNNYSDWLMIAFCMKDLYLSCSPKEQKTVYDLFDNFSNNSCKYDKNSNIDIFNKLEPKVDINYLFNLANINYNIFSFYDYNKIMFDENSFDNVHKTKSKYIKINFNEIVKNKFIYIKSPCGTGKTTTLSKIIKHLEYNSIISITSRVNLASEHMKHLELEFYKNLKGDDFKYCDRLVIQLESLTKINYKLFKNGVVILDEINSLLSHLRSPTLNNKRKDIYLYLIEIIKNAKHIICLDADLCNWNIEFMNKIDNNSSYIYYNNIATKNKINATFYDSEQIVIDLMSNNIKNNKYFISCFDSLKRMNKIIEYLSNFHNKDMFLIYSSEIDYGIIDTKTWINKFVFFTPTIIYGLDFNETFVDVFAVINKSHLNSLQIYQMISRARNQNSIHIYCNNKYNYLKYKTIDAIRYETELFIKNFECIMPNYKDYIDLDIDDEPYKIMYYNHKYIDHILKTNTKSYLIDFMTNKGYNILYNTDIKGSSFSKQVVLKDKIKNKIIDILNLDRNNLDEFHKILVTNDKALDKHFNLRILLNNSVDNKLIDSLDKNIFIETIKTKYTKIKICNELLKILSIDTLDGLNKNVISNFTTKINNNWLNENLVTIKKLFEIRTSKYDSMNYYKIYLLLITILKNLFDDDLFIKQFKKVNQIQYYYYELNNNIFDKHKNIINKISYEDFID
jgi:hypothetical protein